MIAVGGGRAVPALSNGTGEFVNSGKAKRGGPRTAFSSRKASSTAGIKKRKPRAQRSEPAPAPKTTQ
jgi:hypothetical protein